MSFYDAYGVRLSRAKGRVDYQKSRYLYGRGVLAFNKFAIAAVSGAIGIGFVSMTLPGKPLCDQSPTSSALKYITGRSTTRCLARLATAQPSGPRPSLISVITPSICSFNLFGSVKTILSYQNLKSGVTQCFFDDQGN
ncbi:hypothetical protein [Phyllobacterium lublinensis]|uniref:hypothetical protein n=1 Tax=Phyllobacterium lublinensis TaxID=2875708 RepID=UPI001CCCFEFF|nr:hypothetical protein [Phyllobacterium sp. 2063]MBZ9653627.1 hypothetical protein [Phyllobacterium sp. 2063]